MNKRFFRYGICTLMLCGGLSWGGAFEARANIVTFEGPAFSRGDYIASIEEGSHPIYVSMDSYDILKDACQGEVYTITSSAGDGWMEIQVGSGVGYISVEEKGVSVVEKAEMEANGSAETLEVLRRLDIGDSRRQNLVDYALQFLGGRYQAGGNDPHTGVDCSGFTRYVMLNGAGVSINRTSASQSQQGAGVSPDQMRPGDLIFYGNGSRVNHVAMYIGNGQVVHASTYKTGIKISAWNYRVPVCIKNVLGD